MVKRITEMTAKNTAWFKDEIDFCLNKFEDAWFTKKGNGNNAWNDLIDFRINGMKRIGRSNSDIEEFKKELAKAVKRKYGRKYNLSFVDTVYKSQDKKYSEAKENEYGEKLYSVYVNTGTAWCDVRNVYAYNEQDALDKVVDRLEKEESNLVMDYYDIFDMCDTGESVDEFAEANNLICAGNHGLYISVDRIELAE